MKSKNAGSKKIRLKRDTALLIVDVISDFEFEDGEKLFKYALPMARRLAGLKKKAKKAKIPVIYVNNNFGKWQEDFRETVDYCLNTEVRGARLVELLKPEKDDYYVLKPKHSAFYSTTLALLLANLKSKNLILTGVTTDICILFTANDAYMREHQVIIPKDCVAAVKSKENKAALEYIERVLKAEILFSDDIIFD